jgi:tetratricopeptide (TPR) repeat protein
MHRREWDTALACYDRAVKTNPAYARAAWREKAEYDKALADAERAVQLEATSPHTFNARGHAQLALKTFDKARADFDEAIRLDPYFAPGYFGRAGLHLARKQYQPAMRDLDAAIRLSPGNALAMAKRAEAWVACGNPRRALADLDEALAVDPKLGPAHRHRAWLLATTPDGAVRDGKRAVAAAKLAVEHTRDTGGETFEAMAAALAETGDFPGAVVWQTKAVADAGYAKEKGDAVHKRLELYEAKRTYRE